MKDKTSSVLLFLLVIGTILSNLCRFSPLHTISTQSLGFNKDLDMIVNKSIYGGIFFSYICDKEPELSCYTRTVPEIKRDFDKEREHSDDHEMELWYGDRKVEMGLETTALFANLFGLVLALYGTRRSSAYRLQTRLISASLFCIAGILPIFVMVLPLIAYVTFEYHPLPGKQTFEFPYAFPFGALGTILMIGVSVVYFMSGVFEMLQLEHRLNSDEQGINLLQIRTHNTENAEVSTATEEESSEHFKTSLL